MRWRLHDGTLEPVRCGASNRCDYCAMFAALEAALVLKLDAQIDCPTVGMTTTTQDPAFTLVRLRKAEANLWEWLRRRYPELRYCGFLEWTTGEGTHSGGHRRPHIHHLVKGIPADDPRLETIQVENSRGELEETTELEQIVSERWRRYTGDAFVVECRRLRTPAGAIAYLSLHHHKRSQGPPPGIKHVRRLRPSKETEKRRGYYEREIAELRRLAQELAHHKRVRAAASRAIATELHGRDEYEVDEAMTEALVAALRDMASNPLELQIDFAGETDYDAEHAELVARTAAELERIRQERPPELVRVFERERVDPSTGVAVREATAVIGSLTRRAA